MRNFSLIFAIFISISIQGNAASFDCGRASARHEKLICSTPDLSDADGRMGQVYLETIKAFTFPAFIKENQKAWLSYYKSCGNAKKCIEILNERIRELNELKGSQVYTNYAGDKVVTGGGTIIIKDKGTSKDAQFFGYWRQDVHMDPMKIKGYPYDGTICDENVQLVKSSGKWIPEDKNGFSFVGLVLAIEVDKIVILTESFCNNNLIQKGVYKKR
jgi:uncharacterized protein